ncbi:MAG: Rieske 2Fe-2S domain-containing protein [Actinobacteria bacterium]|nr:Rieske 2Fe-2S domain-containing protein [Actinomycetota bacterium]MCB9389605.1 Rieske 2Fe-2S domain-containing protein [Acidimicrobiia bacterium]
MTASTRTERYPFETIPFGWFSVGYQEEFPGGEVRPLKYFGRDLVGFRDDTGAMRVMDAFCPHLGAHLGYGGHVDGEDVVCPFHGWKFNTEGRCVDIPYSDRVNKLAKIRTYPVQELNGHVMVWWHPDDEAPKYEVPEVPELTSEDFLHHARRDWQINACMQELGENSVDLAHFKYIHGTDFVPKMESLEFDGYNQIMKSVQYFHTPRGTTEGHIDVNMYGRGMGTTRFTGIVETLLLTATTPIDEENSHVRFWFHVRKLGDERAESSVGDALVADVSKQVEEDIPVWENKVFLQRPALAKGDQVFIEYRKWCQRFIADSLKSGDVEPAGVADEG